MPVTAAPAVEEQALAASLGDLDALGALFERFQTPLVNYLKTKVQNNQALAEEISAATWERVVAGIREYRRKGAGFEAWLFTIARRCLYAHFRFIGRHPERLYGEMLTFDEVDGASPAEVLEQRFQTHQVAATVNDLPAAQRRCVILRFYSGLSLAETAEVMGKNVNTVKQLQFRALRAMERSLRSAGVTTTREERAVLDEQDHEGGFVERFKIGGTA